MKIMKKLMALALASALALTLLTGCGGGGGGGKVNVNMGDALTVFRTLRMALLQRWRHWATRG